MKFSIIIPVYGVERYIDKCLRSVLDQTYNNYEVIIVNDGSKDNSQKIIDKYVRINNRFKSYIKENGGLSSARNYGLDYITGDYLLFIDSDDYIDNHLLETINHKIQVNQVDLIRFECNTVDEFGNIISSKNTIEYTNHPIEKVINELVTRDFVEPAWLYCYNINFFKTHKFYYKLGCLHEDYGLTPLILYYAQNITSINYHGYNYVQRQGSITKSNNYEKTKKGCDDIFNQGMDIIKIINKKTDNYQKKVIFTYLVECIITRGRLLNTDDYNIYVKKIKDVKLLQYFKTYNVKKLIKKIVAILNIKWYLFLFCKGEKYGKS